MDRLRIIGETPLSGKVKISGAKNAALPILFATILSEQDSIVKNVPLLADIRTTLKVLEALGLESTYHFEKDETITVHGSTLKATEAPYDLVRTMRASVLVLGPLLARKGEAKVSLPGGCAIGARPVDFHLAALEAMGATFKIEQGYIFGSVKNKLKGTEITLPFPSVGATENILMAAVLAEGHTTLRNSACEPEITDLALALKTMGAKISGEGTPTIHIDGVAKLNGMNHRVAADRVEAATYLCAGLASRGSVTTVGIDEFFLKIALDQLKAAGAEISVKSQEITASYRSELMPIDFTTAPFPGFPTDMQAQFMALLTQANGTSKITEAIFENRFMHVPELTRLGAKISVRGNLATVQGPTHLTGAIVMATDLRASASLIVAALAARGETLIRRIYHLDRGYAQLEQKFTGLGAKVFREKE